MGIQINGNTDNIGATDGSLSIEDIQEVNATGVITATNFKTGVSNLHSVGLTLTGGQVDVGSNIKIGTAGVITATSFVGSGANLTGITGTTINNNANNRLITGSGTANTLEGESNFTFDGTSFTVGASGNSWNTITRGDQTHYSGFHFNDSGSSRAYLGVSGATNHIITGSAQHDVALRSQSNLLFAAGGATERLRIDSNGNVMMGVTSSSNRFHVEGTTTGSRFGVDDSASGITALAITNEVNADLETIIYTNKVSLGSSVNIPICFHTNGKANERFRITNDGKFVGGGLANGHSTARCAAGGLDLRAGQGGAGFPSLKIGADSGTANATTLSNNTRKQARIGCASYHNSYDFATFIYFDSDTSTNELNIGGGTGHGYAATSIGLWTAANNATSTGTERMRVHSGGVVSFNNGIELGSGLDATAANTLDDYEEGTYNPIIRTIGSSTGQKTGIGRYTKIGNKVTISVQFDDKNCSAIQNSNYILITNIPFTTNSYSCTSTVPHAYNIDWNGDRVGSFVTQNNSTNLEGYESRSGGSWQYWASGNFRKSQIYLRFNLTYFTNS